MAVTVIQISALVLAVLLLLAVRRSLRASDQPAPSPVRRSLAGASPPVEPRALVPLGEDAPSRPSLPRVRRIARARSIVVSDRPVEPEKRPSRRESLSETGNVVALHPDDSLRKAVQRLEAKLSELQSEMAALREAASRPQGPPQVSRPPEPVPNARVRTSVRVYRPPSSREGDDAR